jgi:hypothetical protein
LGNIICGDEECDEWWGCMKGNKDMDECFLEYGGYYFPQVIHPHVF